MKYFKLNGAKFPTIEELKQSLWTLFKEKMTEEEFNKYVQENVEEIEG